MAHRDVMKFRHGGGCLMLFGAPFFLMGATFLVMGLQGKLKSEGGETTEPWVAALITLPFILVGLALMLGRAGVDIDLRLKRVTRWWGLMIPFRSKRRDLGDFDRITLRRKVVRSDKSTRIVFPVALEGKGDGVDCESLSDYMAARRKAEELSKFTGLDLHDSTQAETVVHEAMHLDETVTDRAKRLGEAVEWPELPANSGIQYETVGENAVIRLPPPGFQWIYLAMAVPALIFVSFFIFMFVIPFANESDSMPGVVRMIFYGFMSLFVVLPLASVLAPAFRGSVLKETVAASWEGIQVERKAWIGSRKWTFPAAELEELTVTRPRLGGIRGQLSGKAGKILVALSRAGRSGSAPGLRLRSDSDFCVFGSSLSDEELEWLQKALTYILVNAPERSRFP